ncbi:hypothetical protein KC960_04095, partial [Candidatus Saccharibacteria bacterium]|nr:hypothetical protein [Candidatus Saccharibacteria bacterium]
MKRVWASLSITTFFIIALLPPLPTKATNEDIWQGTVTITAKDPLTLQQVTNRPDCDFREVSTKIFSPPLDDLITVLSSGNYIANNLGTKCVLSNNQGYFTNSTYSHEAFGPAYELEQPASSTSWYDPAPASDPVLLINKPAFSTVYTVGVEYDFASNGQPTLSLTNVKWHYNGGALPLVDMNGNSVRLSNHAFSANGRFMAVRYNGVVAIVDFDDLSLTPVGYFSSWANNSELAISPNGRYVAVENNGIYVFDAENCQTSYAYGHWDLIQTISPLGCTKSPNLRSQLLSTMGVSQLVSDFQRIRFLGDSSTLYIGAGVRRADAPPNLSGPSAYDWTEYSLRPDGFQTTTSGYLAMGDSFSSGEGDTEGSLWYESGTDEHGDKTTFAGRNLCHLSRRSYPYLMAMNLGYLTSNIDSPPADGLFHSVACSGAKMHNITGIIGEKQDDGSSVDFAITDNQYRYNTLSQIGIWQPGVTKQLNFIEKSTTPTGQDRSQINPELITLSIGGNDVGFGPKIMACVNVGTCPFADTYDDSYRAQAVMEMAKELDNLTKTYEKLKQSAPESRIYVIGYPQFVQSFGGTCASNVLLDDQERQFV